jgi:hypothetical protein
MLWIIKKRYHDYHLMEHRRKGKHPTSGYIYLNKFLSLFVCDLNPSVTIGFGYQGVDGKRKNRLPIRERVYYEKYAEPKVQYSSWFTVVIVVIVLVTTYNSIPYQVKVSVTNGSN